MPERNWRLSSSRSFGTWVESGNNRWARPSTTGYTNKGLSTLLLFSKRFQNIGLIVFAAAAARREPTVGRADDSVEGDVFGDDQISHALLDG